VFFSDGRALGARDVAASFERLVDPKSLSPAQTMFSGVLSPGGASVVDPLTVRFELERPYVDFPALVSSANYNGVVLPADYDGDFERRPVGTGPFRLVGYDNGVKASFTRNRSYWRPGLPFLDGVEMRFADLAAQVSAMKAGEADLMVLTPYEAARTLASDPGVRILRSRSNAWLGLHMRTDTAPWSDRRVRLALALSIDRAALLDVVQGGYGRVGNDDVFSPSFPLSSPPQQRWRDINRARELLAEAGFAGGLEVTLSTINQGAPPEYAQLVQNQAAPAGFRIKLDLQPLAVYYGNGSNQPWRDVPFGLVGWTSAPTPAVVVHETSTCGGVWNASRWCDKAFDGLARRFDALADSSKRQEIASRMAAIQHREVPLVVAYWIDALRAVRKVVSGVRASGSGSVDLSRARINGEH
jgi:peptide/nickel transport system substrate-binding protein